MKQQRFNEAQIIGILKQQESGVTVAQICREQAISEGTFYRWKSKYGGMEVHEVTRLRQLEQENARLKKHAHEWVPGRVDARQCRPQGCASMCFKKNGDARC
ncbi:Transposase [Abditibacterium utsteinense]|uniref:Transposase n=1 Tax=Abditibacterium utsteinense TaxID=1960156 RepID=A0A2S8SNT3_9BACT|nr:Transposase [Abditibacterium utsteinense]